MFMGGLVGFFWVFGGLVGFFFCLIVYFLWVFCLVFCFSYANLICHRQKYRSMVMQCRHNL